MKLHSVTTHFNIIPSRHSEEIQWCNIDASFSTNCNIFSDFSTTV